MRVRSNIQGVPVELVEFSRRFALNIFERYRNGGSDLTIVEDRSSENDRTLCILTNEIGEKREKLVLQRIVASAGVAFE